MVLLMRDTILLLVGIISYVVYFLLFSAIIWLFCDSSYVDIIHNVDWITIYTIFISWWCITITIIDLQKRFKD